MSLPSPASIRASEPGDQSRLATIVHAAFAAGELPGWEPFEIEALASTIGLTPNLTYVAIADGEIAGFLAVENSMVIVAPDQRRRGIGTALVQTAVTAHPGLELAPPVGKEYAQSFLRSVGFVPHHLLWQLIRANGERVGQPEVPAGFLMRTYQDQDFPVYHALLNRTFRDHPTPLSVSEERMRVAHARAEFDPTLILLISPVESPDDPIAFTYVRIHTTAEGISTGSIGLIGVDARYRKRGLGRLLLRWGIWRLQEAGYTTVDLEVVDLNDRALPLYESEGFRRVQSWPYWAPAASGTTARNA